MRDGAGFYGELLCRIWTRARISAAMTTINNAANENSSNKKAAILNQANIGSTNLTNQPPASSANADRYVKLLNQIFSRTENSVISIKCVKVTISIPIENK